jgi:hypothetical protein
MKNPEENSVFQVHFTRQWQDTLLVSLHNFLATIIQVCFVSVCQISAIVMVKMSQIFSCHFHLLCSRPSELGGTRIHERNYKCVQNFNWVIWEEGTLGRPRWGDNIKHIVIVIVTVWNKPFWLSPFPIFMGVGHVQFLIVFKHWHGNVCH